MKTKLTKLSSLHSQTAVLLLAIVAWLPGSARAVDNEDMAHPMLQMNEIKTQAEAEALQPGDSIAMTCAMCKIVTVHKVTKDGNHVKLMTIGETMTCPTCGGTVKVAAAGKGEGKNAEVKFVCSKCGDKAMFVCATKPGTGTAMNLKHKGKQHGEPSAP